MAKSGNNRVNRHPDHVLCLMPCAGKAITSFHCVLPCLVMMCHQTNLDCKSFSVSEDVVKMSVALTLKVAKAFFFFLV